MDGDLTDRAIDYIGRASEEDTPFFLYLAYTSTHYPTLPHPDFDGATARRAMGRGGNERWRWRREFGQCDHRIGVSHRRCGGPRQKRWQRGRWWRGQGDQLWRDQHIGRQCNRCSGIIRRRRWRQCRHDGGWLCWFVDVSTTIADAGSLGGDGGDVTVCRAYILGYGEDCQGDGEANVSAGGLTTTGNNSVGILASSVGGSGGHSGVDIAGSASVGNVNVGVGADGGAGGSGQTVQVYSGGGISTSGDASSAIVATSIGGSGGASYVTGAASAGSIGDVSVAIGGSGGDAGGSLNADVTSRDSITTTGNSSNGIVALSQAGSGGLGGVAVGASGIEAGSADISVGGSGGSGGSAFVNWLGSRMTMTGDHSSGILAQASGGSGGVGGYTVSGQAIGMGSVGVSVGESGGNGGSAGDASVTAHGGSITTSGSFSSGISALSLGGHGGRGGTSIAADGLSQMQANVSVGESGGSGGTSGTAEVQNLGGTVTTNTEHSSGLVAQSIAGNGGQGGMAIEAALDVQFDSELPTGSVGVVLGGSGTGLMGEAGPEAIVPLARSGNGDLGVRSATPNVTVHNHTAAAVDVQQSGDETLIVIGRAVQAVEARFARSMATGQGVWSRGVEAGFTTRRSYK